MPKGKAFSMRGGKLDVSLVDRDDSRSWCKRGADSREGEIEILYKWNLISVPTGWNGKSAIPPRVIHLFRKISI